MSETYLQYVEEQPADVAGPALIRLAGALDTSTSRLRGGDADIPPGQGRASARPTLEEITPERCWELLGACGVGRIALPIPGKAPSVMPVNYSIVDNTIIYRTTPRQAAATETSDEVTFEVDQVDEALRQGWSVLAVGPAKEVTDPEKSRALAEQMKSEPWAGGERPALVRITPQQLTGRRIISA